MKSTLSMMGLISAIFFAATQAEAHHSFSAVFTDETEERFAEGGSRAKFIY